MSIWKEICSNITPKMSGNGERTEVGEGEVDRRANIRIPVGRTAPYLALHCNHGITMRVRYEVEIGRGQREERSPNIN
jgi:hypothetical protein